jgi:capsular polysaccharide biosynthesis protein
MLFQYGTDGNEIQPAEEESQFCSPCSIPPCCWPVAGSSLAGVHEPTGACGRPKFPCTACVGRSVGSGKRIRHCVL